MNTFSPAKIEAVGSLKRSDFLKHLCLIILLGISLFPFYMMLQISLKNNKMFMENPWALMAPEAWQWQNYAYAFKLVLPYVVNSIVVSGGATIGCLAISILGAYFFARYKMPFSNILWSAFLLLMLMPSGPILYHFFRC